MKLGQLLLVAVGMFTLLFVVMMAVGGSSPTKSLSYLLSALQVHVL